MKLATDREIDVVREENKFDKILSNTTGKCKITDRMKYDPTDRILQICHHDGQIKIDQPIRHPLDMAFKRIIFPRRRLVGYPEPTCARIAGSGGNGAWASAYCW